MQQMVLGIGLLLVAAAWFASDMFGDAVGQLVLALAGVGVLLAGRTPRASA